MECYLTQAEYHQESKITFLELFRLQKSVRRVWKWSLHCCLVTASLCPAPKCSRSFSRRKTRGFVLIHILILIFKGCWRCAGFSWTISLILYSKMLNPWQLLEPQISQRQEKRWSCCCISLLSLNKLHNLCLTTYFTHRQEEQGELYELVRAGNSIISHDYYYKIFGKLTQ